MPESTESKSTQALHEALSAAMDGEAQSLELRRALNAARDDAEISAKWERMHLAQSLMRGERPHRGEPQRPWLDGSTPKAASGGRAWRRWAGPLTGTAVAAAAAWLVVAYFGGAPEQTPPPPSAAWADRAPPRGLEQLRSELDLRRANRYLLQHAQHTAATAHQPALPFAKVLASDDPPHMVPPDDEAR